MDDWRQQGRQHHRWDNTVLCGYKEQFMQHSSEKDQKLKTKKSRTMLYSVVTRNSRCMIYRKRELDGRLKTTRKKISRIGQCTVHSISSSTGYGNRNNITVGCGKSGNITVSCGDYERTIKWVVLNWEDNYSELWWIGAANTVQKIVHVPHRV